MVMVFNMNRKQKEAYDIAIAGHSLYIGGPAGTGKSYLLSEIADGLRKANKNVHVTCTTGIACANFSNAMTVHRWAGIDDGRYPSREVGKMIKETAKHRITHADCLIIDEISMLSDKLFQQLEEVCSLKNQDLVFGGIQLILCGDFRQLPPVPNVQYNDEGKFCFQSELFQIAVPHRIFLRDIIRQQDETLITAIQEVSEGTELSENTLCFINSLERSLPDGPPSVKLFATNNLVDDYNRKCVLNWRGDLVEYSSVDSGDKKDLSKILAPQKLWLKEGCPVVLLRNMSNVLYNGLQGHIVSLEKDGPVVDFGSLGLHRVAKIRFTVFSPATGRNVAERLQYPLKLAFALSIHKAQGMTLDRVEVDCRNIFKAGQLGVAMGRVRSAAGLRILNFKPSVCIQQPDTVQMFIDSPSKELDNRLNCCFAIRQMSMDWQSIFDQEEKDNFVIDGDRGCEAEKEEVDEDDFDDGFNEIIVSDDIFSGDELSEYALPASFNPEALLQAIKSQHEVTAVQRESNELINQLLECHAGRISDFCKKQFIVLSAFMDDLGVTASGPVKNDALCHFYERCNMHQTSQEYLLNAMLLFQDLPRYTDAQAHICYKLTVEVRKFLLQEKVKLFQSDSNKRSTYQRFVTGASKARIRYVGGYCISKVRFHHLQLQKTKSTKVSAEDQLQYEESTMAINILDALRANEITLQNHSVLPETLVDVIRKQNVSRGLTQISDEMFLVFMELCEHCLANLTYEHLHQYGQQVHSQCLDAILGNQEIFEQFLKAVQNVPVKTFMEVTNEEDSLVIEDVLNQLTLKVSAIQFVYKAIVEKFVMVMMNQFRKDLLQAFSVEKTLAHRKQILIKKSRQSDHQGTISFDSIRKDDSAAKDMSHSLLKGLLLQKKDVLKSFSKNNLQALSKAYLLKVTKMYTKAKLIQDLTARILSSDAMPNPQAIPHNDHKDIQMTETTISQKASASATLHQISADESQPGPSSEPSFVEPQEGPSTLMDNDKSRLQTDACSGVVEEEEVCKVCNTVGSSSFWIFCESCSKWLHRNCAGLRSKKKWDNTKKKGVIFFCNDCL